VAKFYPRGRQLYKLLMWSFFQVREPVIIKISSFVNCDRVILWLGYFKWRDNVLRPLDFVWDYPGEPVPER